MLQSVTANKQGGTSAILVRHNHFRDLTEKLTENSRNFTEKLRQAVVILSKA